MNVCRFLIAWNAFDARTTCDVADVHAVLQFSPNPLKYVFSDILDGIVDVSSQFWKHTQK
jgi:hypothetical protein